jgi:F420-dependent oxidoreductase-like protein
VRKLRIGIKIPPQQISARDLRASWELAEGAGFDNYWTYDHLAPVMVDRQEPIFEAWTLIAAAAAATQRVRLGVVVTANTFRNPGLLAKMASTVDHLSGGRLEFGIGAAWEPFEHEMLDLPHGTPADHIRRLDESLTIIKSLWTEAETSFEGRFYRVRRAVSQPKPLQSPHPPVWIGAAGERLALRVVATHADVWNLIAGTGGVDSPAAARRKCEVLAEHCHALGRDPGEISRSLSWYYGGGEPAAAVEEILPYLELGFTEIILNARPVAALADASLLAATVVPALRSA